MKKIIIAIMAVVLSAPAFAQFEKGQSYMAVSTSSLNMNYNSGTKFNFNLDATAGHYFVDDFMLLAKVGYNHSRVNDVFNLGVGARYYMSQNGLHIGANAEYRYDDASVNKHNNWFLGPEIGYTFFLNRHVTIEPALYYNISLNNFSGDSEVGLRIGFGFFFNAKSTKKAITSK